MTTRPRKPWRVTLAGQASEHTSEKAAYAFLVPALRRYSAATARVDQWEGGRWWHFETVKAADLPPAP